jgi:hypothetical protein
MKKAAKAEKAAPDGSQSYRDSKLGRARYEVEQEFFRTFFYEKTAAFIDGLLEPLGLSNLYCTALKESGFRPKYYVDEFAMDSDKTEAGNYRVSCGLPKPEFEPFCYRVHFMFDRTMERKAYYTVEREGDAAVLCLRDEEGNRHVLQPIAQPNLADAEDKAAALAEEVDAVVAHFEQGQELQAQSQGQEPEQAKEPQE